MATIKDHVVLFENGKSTVVTTNAKHNSITVVPYGVGVCQLQAKGVEGAEWVDIALFDSVSKFQVDIDDASRLWVGSIANTFAFRINPDTCTFDRVEARFV